MSSPSSRQPIFVVNQGRTGSTLLRYILDTHEEIYCPPETPWARTMKGAFDLNKGLFEYRPLYSDPERLEEKVSEETRQSFTRIMDRGTAEMGKKLWCLTHAYSNEILPFLKKVYPDAKYICLYRHCMDYLYSALDTLRYNWNSCGFYEKISARNRSNVVNSLADHWCEHTKATYDFEHEKKYQCFRVKYESIVLQPQATCRELFTFLGVNYHDDLVKNIFVREHQPGLGDKKILGTRKIEPGSVGQGRKIARRAIDTPTFEKMNALLKALDYEIVGEDWNSKPASMYAVGDQLKQRYAADKLKEIFEHMIPGRLKSLSWPTDPMSCEVQVNDIENAAWLVDFAGAKCTPSNGKQIADGKIFVDFETLVKVFRNEVNPWNAWRNGLIYFEGNRLTFENIGKVIGL